MKYWKFTVLLEAQSLISIVNWVTRAMPDEGVTRRVPGRGSGNV